MILEVYEVFEKFEKAKNRAEKISILKENESWPLKDVIKGSMDPKIQWLIPGGEVPYTPAEIGAIPSTLRRRNTDFAYCVKGGKGNNLPAFKRERIFLGIVESIHPKDAELVCKMVNKEKPAKGLTEAIVKEAFPGLL